MTHSHRAVRAHYLASAASSATDSSSLDSCRAPLDRNTGRASSTIRRSTGSNAHFPKPIKKYIGRPTSALSLTRASTREPHAHPHDLRTTRSR